ncbi:hypothetical protein HPB48_021969 [Haemaphysalis longicornis]|uniref:Uncharacterized protein n=1 Tax=Haemaphysalis longicornis TaxID=44386 RepID=A0A9J6GAB4_HAELO|nr:hypothetical protein HPB48_021969 [Haemaphysalis longicornis]
MMAATRAATGREIVANCFAHAGFKLGDADADFPEDPADCNEAVRRPAEALTLWAALQDAGNVPCGVQLNDFINADADVIAHEELSDEDIIKSVHGVDSDEDEVPDLPPPPATARVLDAFDMVRNCVAVDDDDVTMQLLTECREQRDGIPRKENKADYTT